MSGPTDRQRADLLLVARGVFDSRARAQEAIAAGLVRADSAVVRKPSDRIDVAAAIEAEPPHPYVSRGGVKLAAALDRFGLSPAGRICLDVGASTGGFTDVLLGRGAARVYAVDVGRDQLHPRIAADTRVVSLEGVDARQITPELVPEQVDFVVVDVSFISLKLVLPGFEQCLSTSAQLVALVKPQFEAGRHAVGRGGIVRDEDARLGALHDIVAFAESRGWRPLGTVPSPITGRDGNREFLMAAERG